MAAIAETGLQEILILTGESRNKSTVEYIGEACKIARKYFKVIGLEVYPVNSDEYAYLHECGADYVTVFQETYNSDKYETLHLAGHKRIYPYRVNAQERALKGGMRGVGFGALLGLDDFRKDAFATGYHAYLLQRKYPHAEIAFSCPRLRPIINNDRINPMDVHEPQLLQVVCAYRLFIDVYKRQVEDECILELVAKIKELGHHVITDGEFRISTWHLDFMWGFEGIEHQKTVEGNTTFDAEAAMIDDTYMTGKISVKNHPFVEHFKFIKALEDENTVAKQTIPSPGQFYAYFTGAQLLNTTLEIYGSEEAFAEDVIKAYGEFVQEIYAAGCRNLQFDDCVWGGMVDAKMAVALTGRTGQRLEDYKKLLLELNNQVVAQAPEDLVINTHV